MESLSKQISRFYGLSIPDLVLDVIEEGLTDLETNDLFTAHLARNRAYFGAVDKTLSGFVVLSDRGDDFFLLDSRDTGWVYWQDHEERTFTPCFRSLSEYLEFHKTQNSNSESFRSLLPSLTIHDLPQSNKSISTVELAVRYQWAVWCLGQVSDKSKGKTTESHWLGVAVDWFLHTTNGVEDAKVMYKAEAGFLKSDTHLAIWWLLVATVVADQPWIDEIIESGPKGSELFLSFSQNLNSLSLRKTLEVLPQFRKRRAAFLLQIAETCPNLEDMATLLSRSFVADPMVSFDKKMMYLSFASNNLYTDAYIKHILQSIEPDTVLYHIMMANLDKYNQNPSSDSARIVAEWILKPTLSGDFKLSKDLVGSFVDIAVLIADKHLAYEACKSLLKLDAFYFSLVELTVEIGQALESLDVEEYKSLYEQLTEIRPIYDSMFIENPNGDELEAIAKAEKLDAPKKQLLIQRVLDSPESFKPSSLKWAMLQAIDHVYAQRAQALFRSFKALGLGSNGAIAQMKQKSPKPNMALKQDLKAVLELFTSNEELEDVMLAFQEKNTVKELTTWIEA